MSDVPAFDYGVAASAIETLPAVLQARRELLGLSLRDVDKATGVNYKTLSRFERGQSIAASCIVALMRWLDKMPAPPLCERPPDGWWCPKVRGHDGPCAAREWTSAPA